MGIVEVLMKILGDTVDKRLPAYLVLHKEVSKLPPVDPTAELYRRGRDLFVCSEGVSCAERLGVLLLLQNELVRSMQATLDEVD
jgi:hypothetical protein